MYTKIANKINTYALKIAESKKPDINSYIIGTDDEIFYKMYANNDTFVQLTLYENSVKTEAYITPKNWEVLKEQIETYNSTLKDAQVKAVETAKLIEEYFDEKTYYYFNRISSDLGIMVYSAHIRNKKIEEERQVERIREHNHLMETDAEYRAEYNWHNAEYRPFGGAFNSWDDYYNYRK